MTPNPSNPTQTEDWVMVPREPTLEMQRAYFDVIDRNRKRVENDYNFGRFNSNREAYRAMLSAAPTISPRGSDDRERQEMQQRFEYLATKGTPPRVITRHDAAYVAAALASLSPRGRGEGLDRDVVEALTIAEDTLSRFPFSSEIWPNGMHPNTGIGKIRDALAALSSAPVSGGGGPPEHDPLHAINWLLDGNALSYGEWEAFLHHWRMGDLSEFPDYVEWVAALPPIPSSLKGSDVGEVGE